MEVRLNNFQGIKEFNTDLLDPNNPSSSAIEADNIDFEIVDGSVVIKRLYGIETTIDLNSQGYVFKSIWESTFDDITRILAFAVNDINGFGYLFLIDGGNYNLLLQIEYSNEYNHINFLSGNISYCLFSNGYNYYLMYLNKNTNSFKIEKVEFTYIERLVNGGVKTKTHIRGTKFAFDGLSLILSCDSDIGQNVGASGKNQIYYSSAVNFRDFEVRADINNSAYKQNIGFYITNITFYNGTLLVFGEKTCIAFIGDYLERMSGGFERINNFCTGCISSKATIVYDNNLIYYDFYNNAIYSVVQNENNSVKTIQEKMNLDFVSKMLEISVNDAYNSKFLLTNEHLYFIIPNYKTFIIHRITSNISVLTYPIYDCVFTSYMEHLFISNNGKIGEKIDNSNKYFDKFYPAKYRTTKSSFSNASNKKYVKMPAILTFKKASDIEFSVIYNLDNNQYKQKVKYKILNKENIIITNTDDNIDTGYFNDSDEPSNIYKPFKKVGDINVELKTIKQPTNFYNISITFEEESETDFLPMILDFQLKGVNIINKYLGQK
jgi:hypothetical protein